MNIFDIANEWIRKSETSLVNLLSAIAPWGAPLAPAYMSYGGMVKHLSFTPFVALVIAFVIEILGLATVHTTLLFWQHNRRYKADQRRMPTMLAAGMFALYLIIILVVNVLMEWLIDWPFMPILARALLSLLAVPAAVTLAIRTLHAELLSEIQGNRKGSGVQPTATKTQPPQVAQLTGTKKAVLEMVTSNPTATNTDIGRKLGISRQAVAKHIDTLEKAGLLIQTEHPNHKPH